jgi:hypothetical protein
MEQTTYVVQRRSQRLEMWLDAGEFDTEREARAYYDSLIDNPDMLKLLGPFRIVRRTDTVI